MSNENQEVKQEQSPEELFEAMSSAMSTNDDAALRKLLDENAEPEEQSTPTAEEEVEKEEPKEGEEIDTPAEEGSEEAAKTENGAASAAKDDLDYKKAYEEARRELHRYKSDAGRVPFLQKRLAELERQGRSTTSPTAKPQVEIDPNSALAQKLAKYKEIDPDLADLLLDVVKDTAAQAMSHTEQSVEAMRAAEEEAENQRFYNEQISILAEHVPQYQQIFAMPEWSQWKDTLSPGQRAMAESGYASDVMTAIRAFGNFMQARNPQQQGNTNTQQQAAPNDEARKVQAKRQQRQESSPSSKSTPAKKEKEFDADAYFMEQFEKIKKENHLV